MRRLHGSARARAAQVGAVFVFACAAVSPAGATAPPPPPAERRAEPPPPAERHADPARAAAPASDLAEALDALMRSGYDQPDAALERLDMLAAEHRPPAQARRILLARGLILAFNGREAQALAVTAQLHAEAEASAHGDEAAAAYEQLVLAALTDQQGKHELASKHARGALDGFQRTCARPSSASEECNWRDRWAALEYLGAAAVADGNAVNALAQWRRAFELAQASNDEYRQVLALAQMAVSSSDAGDDAAARQLIVRAQRLARQSADLQALSRVKLAETNLPEPGTADPKSPGFLATALEGARLARAAASPRLEARFLANLSDYYVKHGQPAQALAAIERALPVVRRHGELGSERLLRHNALLARIRLHQVDNPKAEIDAVLAATGYLGAGTMKIVLEELSDALADAGDYRESIELYHRERKLAADIMADNRSTALKELQARYDTTAQLRNIELLERDNALQAAQIANRTLMQRLWTLVALLLTLAVAVALPLLRRVRRTQGDLRASHARLRHESERDALTGLVNRRRALTVLREAPPGAPFRGALMLLDLDHFKRINDEHGHAAGDTVLQELARRLLESVRSTECIARWGGEEFLVIAPATAPEALDALVARLLRAVSEQPVIVNGVALSVSCSIGYASFPLAACALRLDWEQCVGLVDLALYHAKRSGRHAAVCVAGAPGLVSLESLRGLKDGLEQGARDGTLALRLQRGPAPAPTSASAPVPAPAPVVRPTAPAGA